MADLPPIIDATVIADLSSVGGPRGALLLQRVLDLFISRAPQSISDLEMTARGRDLEALADAAHALKSMCASIGAKRAFAACHSLEKAARAGEAGNVQGLVSEISHEIAAALVEARSLRAA